MNISKKFGFKQKLSFQTVWSRGRKGCIIQFYLKVESQRKWSEIQYFSRMPLFKTTESTEQNIHLKKKKKAVGKLEILLKWRSDTKMMIDHENGVLFSKIGHLVRDRAVVMLFVFVIFHRCVLKMDHHCPWWVYVLFIVANTCFCQPCCMI